MNQKPHDCCAEPAHGLLPVDEARQRMLDAVSPLADIEQVHLRGALGRVLAEDVVSSIDIPPCANSAMDGYAVRAADLDADGQVLALVGRSMAGAPWDGTMEAGQCVRIMTGAMMPAGADTVIMQEQVDAQGDDIHIGGGHQRDQNVRHPGEDIAAGDTVLVPGRRLTAADLGVLASIGRAEVRVKRRLRVAMFSTGDELRGVGQSLGPGDIYDSNRYTLHAMLTRLGVEVIDMGVVPDDRNAVRAAFSAAAGLADAVITSGGVSVGEADFVKETLDEMGQVTFWKIAIKPGKPLAFGHVGQAVFFGLPGNPVSVMATFYQFAQPTLLRMTGETAAPTLLVSAVTELPLKKAPGRAEFQRGVLSIDNTGRLVVRGTGVQGSHILTSMSRANCFIVLPAESAGAAAGDTVQVQAFAGLI